MTVQSSPSSSVVPRREDGRGSSSPYDEDGPRTEVRLPGTGVDSSSPLDPDGVVGLSGTDPSRPPPSCVQGLRGRRVPTRREREEESDPVPPRRSWETVPKHCDVDTTRPEAGGGVGT